VRRRRAAAIVAAAAVLLTALSALIPGWRELGAAWRICVIAGAVIGLLAIWLTDLAADAVVLEFDVEDWTELGDDRDPSWQYRVPFRRHGRRHPSVTVYERGSHARFHEVEVAVTIEHDKGVTLASSRPFWGRVRIH
jgi:hypothetical protein